MVMGIADCGLRIVEFPRSRDRAVGDRRARRGSNRCARPAPADASRRGRSWRRCRLSGLARVAVASPRLNADNAAMIARAGWYRLGLGERSDWTLDARADLPLPGLEPAPTTLGAARS